MWFLQRSIYRILVITLMIICCMFNVLFVSSARADVGVQPILPAGSSILPEKETVIQMAAEKVAFTIHVPTEADISRLNLDLQSYGMVSQEIPLVAEVDARFWMLNPQADQVDMLVWFPLAASLENVTYDNFGSPMPGSVAPSIRDFEVFVENQPVETTITEFANPNGEEFPPLPWSSFPVSFTAGEETLIEVRYLLPAQSIPGNYVTAIFSYIFRTGSGWAGPIGEAELEVKLPYPASQETVGQVTADGQINGSQVSWTWLNFEPKATDDFSIELLRPEYWKSLNDMRAAVKANSEDGEAWLNLARLYQRLTTSKGQRIAPGIDVYFHTLAIDALENTARLLPEESSVHASLASLYLPFPLEDAYPEEFQRSLDELKLAEQLEAKYPPAEGEMTVEMVREFFGDRLDAAATQIVQRSAETPTLGPEVQSPTITPKPSDRPTHSISATPSPTESPTAVVVSSTPAAGQSKPEKSRPQDLVLAVFASLIVLVVVGYLVFQGQLKRLRK